MEPEPQMEPGYQEFKTIPTVQTPMEGYMEPEPEPEPEPQQQQQQPQPQPEDDDVLFGDAPETRTKKVGYY